MDDRWLSELHWRRKGKQTRSEKTQAALIDAAQDLILEKGTKGTSIADIAAKAGCSVGTVYHHFKDKTALYYALFHRMTEEFAELNRQAVDPARWEGATVHDLFSNYIDLMNRLREEAAPTKAAAALVVADHPDLRDHFSEMRREGRLSLLGLVLARGDEIRHPDPDWAARFAIDQVGAMLHARADPNLRLAAIDQSDDDRFKDEAMAWVSSLLGLQDQP